MTPRLAMKSIVSFGGVLVVVSFFLFFFTWPPASNISETIQPATIPITLSEVKDFTIPEPSAERLKEFPPWDKLDHAFVLFVGLTCSKGWVSVDCLHSGVVATLIVIRSSMARMVTFHHSTIFSGIAIDCES